MIITVNILRITSCLQGTWEFLRTIEKSYWEGLEKKRVRINYFERVFPCRVKLGIFTYLSLFY